MNFFFLIPANTCGNSIMSGAGSTTSDPGGETLELGACGPDAVSLTSLNTTMWTYPRARERHAQWPLGLTSAGSLVPTEQLAATAALAAVCVSRMAAQLLQHGCRGPSHTFPELGPAATSWFAVANPANKISEGLTWCAGSRSATRNVLSLCPRDPAVGAPGATRSDDRARSQTGSVARRAASPSTAKK